MAGRDDGPGQPRPAEQPASEPPPAKEPARGWRTSEWPLLRNFRTGEWPRIRIDLTEAYEAVRRRGEQLRRRRIITAIVAALVLAASSAVIGIYYVGKIPLPDALSLPETTTVYYSDGETVMARLGSENRTLVSVASLPAYVGDAVIAAEDPGYWLDSTTVLSRQYARAATGLNSSSPTAQARLLVMTWKLEDTYTKDQILEFYLNTVYFGRGAYGIEAAARAYFNKRAADLTLAESIVLAGMLESPGDGRYDPSLNLASAHARFAAVTERMRSLGTIDEPTIASLRMPIPEPYDLTLFESALDRPTGLVVAHVLAELRAAPPFRDQVQHYIEEGGFRIVTTIHPAAQDLLERYVDETRPGSLMYGQADNVQAAAAMVQPGTGRVLAYYGGHDGTGADYASWYRTESGAAAGFGAHPPGETFFVYVLATAINAGIPVQSVVDSPPLKAFPDSGRGPGSPVRDYVPHPCQPQCTLVEATTGSLKVPFFALTEQLGPATVIDTARAAGISTMWVPESAEGPRRRYDLTAGNIAALTPQPFDAAVGIGAYPVTVLDQASAMATFAAGGVPSRTHFVREVTKGGATLYTEPLATGNPVLGAGQAAELGWVLSQSSIAVLEDGRTCAAKSGTAPVAGSAIENAHAWTIGYTPEAALAVWIGNKDVEYPLWDKYANRITGDSLPADIFRAVMSKAAGALGVPATPLPDPPDH